VIAGPVAEAGLSPAAGVLVTPRGGSAAVTYLLHDGRRSRVDLRHGAVVRALRLDGVVPQPLSSAVLDAIPEAPSIEPPHVPALGSPGPPMPGGHPVGTVVQVFRTGTSVPDYFVVLADGLQRIGEVAADLLRYTDGRAGDEIPAVAADVLGALPVVTSLPVTTFPHRADVRSARVVCARWRPHPAENASHTEILVGDAMPETLRSVTLAQADGSGPAVDTVSVPPGRSMFVRSVGVTGAGQSSGPLFLVTESGAVHGVWDDETAKTLGLNASAVPAPWPVLSVLPRGPELNRRGASVARDGVGTSP
jgi:type VII secretion protein EccB